mmetsp:Transcript_19563/g.52524  ORF Transcript_19563/g.52524 Transcript_19563/m.52524 type:complete len:272 (-) Transcript_19563:360-1175(-)
MGSPVAAMRGGSAGNSSSRPAVRHISGLELIVLSILIVRALRAMPPILAALGICMRRVFRCTRRLAWRLGRWYDRHCRRPRYMLRCDLSAVEPGVCPVCLAPLAGEANGPDREEEEGGDQMDGDEGSKTANVEAENAGVATRAIATPALLRLRCGHTFHAECLDSWLDRRGTCPLCRSEVGDLRDCVEMRGLDPSAAAAAAQRSAAAAATTISTSAIAVAPAPAPAPWRATQRTAAAARDVSAADGGAGLAEPMLGASVAANSHEEARCLP